MWLAYLSLLYLDTMQSRFGIGSSLRLGRIHVLLLVPFFLCRTSGKSRTKGKKDVKWKVMEKKVAAWICSKSVMLLTPVDA